MVAIEPNAGLASFEIEDRKGTLAFMAAGDWSVRNIVPLDADLRAFSSTQGKNRKIIFDLSNVTRLDTSGAWVFRRMAHDAGDARIEGVTADFKLLLDK